MCSLSPNRSSLWTLRPPAGAWSSPRTGKSVRYTRQKQNLLDSPCARGSPVELVPGFSSGAIAGRWRCSWGTAADVHGGVVREEVEKEGGAGPERRGGRFLHGGPLPPAVLGQHPPDRPAAERHPATTWLRLWTTRRGRVALLDADTQAPIFTFTASFLPQSLSLLRCLEKGFLPYLERLKQVICKVRRLGIQQLSPRRLLGHGISKSL